MTYSYKVWREDNPDDFHILHLWEPKTRGDLKIEAGKRFWPEIQGVGDIQVKRLGRK